MSDFEKKYQRAIHAQLDELLDADERIYVGAVQHLNKAALAERVAKKWAFDEIVRAHSKAQYGKAEVVRAMRTSIESYKSTIAGLFPTSSIDQFQRTIEMIENFIVELNK